MTGSPFSLVLGSTPDNSTFKNVESTQVGDTTDPNAIATSDTGTESSIGVEFLATRATHEAEQDETAGQTDVSGTPSQ